MKKVFLLASAAAFACGGSAKSIKPSGDGAPNWVSQGSGEVGGEGGKKVQGIGSASGADAKARRLQADAAAKVQLESAVAVLSASLTRLSNLKQSSVGEEIAGLAKEAAAKSQQIRDHWVTNDGNEMALDVLELSAFQVALRSLDGDDKLKTEMSSNADKAFDEMAKR